MKALALHLIEGSVDQVGVVTLSLQAAQGVAVSRVASWALVCTHHNNLTAHTCDVEPAHTLHCPLALLRYWNRLNSNAIPVATCGNTPDTTNVCPPVSLQVAQEVTVSWVASRVLTKAQVSGLKERLDGWISKVNAISNTLEQESIGVALEVV